MGKEKYDKVEVLFHKGSDNQQELYKWINEQAKEKMISKSALVRTIIQEMMQKS
jgi:hypothetical protein